jgi:hypothetical protein
VVDKNPQTGSKDHLVVVNQKIKFFNLTHLRFAVKLFLMSTKPSAIDSRIFGSSIDHRSEKFGLSSDQQQPINFLGNDRKH